jgi:cytoskeletal protein CcmA (bactofilin family)
MLGSKKAASVAGGTTLISQETVIVGDVHFCGNLDIEGLVQGNIIAQPGKEALLRVVGKGRVEGEIRVPSVVINGVVEGDVYSSKHLELASKSRVQGSVFYALVEMAAGAEVNGSLTHMSDAGAVADPVAGQTDKALPTEAPAKAPGKDAPTKVD